MSLKTKDLKKIDDVCRIFRVSCEGEPHYIADWLATMVSNDAYDQDGGINQIVWSLREIIEAAEFAIDSLDEAIEDKKKRGRVNENHQRANQGC